MDVQSFSYEIALLLTKYAGRWANFVQKTLKIMENHSLGIDTLFATMSEPLREVIPNKAARIWTLSKWPL